MGELTVAEQEAAAFELAQRRAMVYSESTLVPKTYQKNVGNVLVAQNMATRMGADLLMVMQNLYIVHGKPGWSSQFLIACFNQSGRFSSIKYRFTGEKGKDSWGCIAQTMELETAELIEGPEVTIGMAKAEGWYDKNGSKWKTLPQLMLQYRAAAFLIRTTAPEIGMGLQTREELYDTGDERTVEGKFKTAASAALAALEGPKDEEPEDDSVSHESLLKTYIASLNECLSEEAINQSLLDFIDTIDSWSMVASAKAPFVNELKSAASKRLDEITEG